MWTAALVLVCAYFCVRRSFLLPDYQVPGMTYYYQYNCYSSIDIATATFPHSNDED